jgi:hypothetical protein
MFKATASQRISALIVAKDTGNNVTTGTCTVYVKKDGGSQAAGNVSSGAATHVGNGQWEYVADATDTNGDYITFEFVHSTGMSALRDVYTQDKQVSDRLAAGAKAMAYGTVGTSGHTTTSISLTGGSITPSLTATDQVKGRVLLFAYDTTTAALRGQGAPIDGNSTSTITIAPGNALTTAPASGDTFVIA